MTSLPTELYTLVWLMILAASMWIPFIAGAVKDPGATDGFVRPHDVTKLRPWVHRAHRAHLNLLEQAMPFAILVLIVDRADGFSAMTYWTAIAFFWIRVVHAIGMISGLARFPLRPILYNAGWVCCLIMGYAALTA